MASPDSLAANKINSFLVSSIRWYVATQRPGGECYEPCGIRTR